MVLFRIRIKVRDGEHGEKTWKLVSKHFEGFQQASKWLDQVLERTDTATLSRLSSIRIGIIR